MEFDSLKKLKWNRPKRLGDKLEFAVGSKMPLTILLMDPFSSPAITKDEFWCACLGSIDVVKQASIDELLGRDGIALVFWRQARSKLYWQLQLMIA